MVSIREFGMLKVAALAKADLPPVHVEVLLKAWLLSAGSASPHLNNSSRDTQILPLPVRLEHLESVLLGRVVRVASEQQPSRITCRLLGAEKPALHGSWP